MQSAVFGCGISKQTEPLRELNLNDNICFCADLLTRGPDGAFEAKRKSGGQPIRALYTLALREELLRPGRPSKLKSILVRSFLLLAYLRKNYTVGFLLLTGIHCLRLLTEPWPIN